MGRPKMPPRDARPAEFVRAIDAASILSVSYKTLEHWRRKKVGPPFTKRGKYLRYEINALREWMREGTVRPGDGESAEQPGGAS